MSSRTPDQITQDVIAKLSITAPGLSLEIGTPERKFLEAVAEAISEVQVDNHLVSNQLDIDTKAGVDLEDFVGVFSYGRLQGKYASGVVTFTLSIPAVQPILIPTGTQVFSPATANNSLLTYSTTATRTIEIGQKTISVPVQATIIGTIGNAPSGSVTGFSAGLGVSSCSNVESFTGGQDDETDEELRARFKKTFLRNIAGTEDFYVGLALQMRGVNRVKVLGPVSEFEAQIQAGSANSSTLVPAKNCKFVWPLGFSVFENAGQQSEIAYTDITDFSFSTGSISAPSLTANASTANKFLDIRYEYNSTNSRNDPVRGITNKIDVYVDGLSTKQIEEKILTKAITLSSDINDPYFFGNFKSFPTGYTINASSKFQRLGSTPITSWPNVINVSGTAYTLGTNYFGVYDNTINRGTEREISGIVWMTTPPADNISALVTYTYNQVPEVLNALIKRTKQLATDPLVHTAVQKFLQLNFIIMYSGGYSPAQVEPKITEALTRHLASLPFGSWIQISDLVTVVHNVPGVDNCRIARTTDGVSYSISEMEGGVSTGVTYTTDFQLPDNSVPVLDSVNLIRRSFNNFNS